MKIICVFLDFNFYIIEFDFDVIFYGKFNKGF